MPTKVLLGLFAPGDVLPDRDGGATRNPDYGPGGVDYASIPNLRFQVHPFPVRGVREIDHLSAIFGIRVMLGDYKTHVLVGYFFQ